MIIKIILSLIFMFLVVYAYRQRTHARFVSDIVVIAALLGEFLVLFPAVATDVASAVGVGRGADLVMYVFVTVALVLVFMIHLRMREMLQMLTLLSRNMAISAPRLPRTVEQDKGSGGVVDLSNPGER